MRGRRLLLAGSLFVSLGGCGDDAPKTPTFNKPVPEVEERHHGRTLADWKAYDGAAPAEVRAETAYALAALEKTPSESERLLLELLGDQHPSVRLAAVIATGRLRLSSPVAAEVLAGYLGSDDEPLRRHARQSLRALGAVVVEPLRAALKSASVRVRWGALASMSGVGNSGEAAAREVDRMVRQDPNATVRRQALLTLPLLGPRGIELALAYLRGDDIAQRNEAATALGMAGPGAVTPLTWLLKDEDEEVAARAAGILADLGTVAVTAKAALLEALTRGGPVRFNAAEALIAFGSVAVPELQQLAASKDEGMAAIARYALEKIQGN